LTKAEGWDKVMENIDFVLHVAFPLGGNNYGFPQGSLLSTEI
jgi:hypothetical protein